MSSFEVSISVSESGRKAPQYTIDSDLKGEITLTELFEFFRTSLATIAFETLKEEQDLGFDKKPVISVDGRVGRRIDQVKPFGQIEITARAEAMEILLDAYQAVLDRSPVDTGLYISSHIVVWNTTVIAKNMGDLRAWLSKSPELKDSDSFVIVNTQPYARRLERLGVTAGNGSFSSRSPRYQKSRDKRQRSGPQVLAPNGAYFLASRAIKRKYKRNSTIRFKFIPGYVLGLGAVFKTFSKASGTRKRSKSKPSTYLYPAIVISLKEGGTV